MATDCVLCTNLLCKISPDICHCDNRLSILCIADNQSRSRGRCRTRLDQYVKPISNNSMQEKQYCLRHPFTNLF